MATSTIVLKGIALSYLKTENPGTANERIVWRVLFPFDQEDAALGCHHRVKLQFDNGETIFLGKNILPDGVTKRLTTVEIRPRAPVKPASVKDIGTYSNFLDITQGGGVIHDHVEILPVNPNEIDMVKLTIPNAEMSVQTFFEYPVRVVRVEGMTETPTTPHYRGVGHTARVEIECDGFEISVTGAQNFTRFVGRDKSITFDNDCERPDLSPDDDFDMIYKILKDKDVMGRRYRLQLKYTPAVLLPPVPPIPSNPSIEDRSIESKEMFSPKGLPCEMLAVGQSGDLP